MEIVPYMVSDELGSWDGEIEISEGSTDKPVIVLLHGTAGTIDDMTNPARHPDNNYGYDLPLPADVDIGWRAYPGIGVWSCCQLDDKKEVVSWRDLLGEYGFRTAAYSQIDNTGFLARPTLELAVVMETLAQRCTNAPFVLLAQSRGGLLVRNFLRRHRNASGRVEIVITLHSPHTGSSLASIASTVRSWIETLESAIGGMAMQLLGWLYDLARSDAYQEMAVGSPFLTELAQETPLKNIDYYTFGGTSVRLSRALYWAYTLGSAIPQWHWPPYEHVRTMEAILGVSPIANSLPNIIPELSDGRGDLLTADARTRLPYATHQTNAINHAETLWHPRLQAQVLRILGENPDIPPVDDEPSFWE